MGALAGGLSTTVINRNTLICMYGSPHMSYRGRTRYTSQETGPRIDYMGSGCTHLTDHQGGISASHQEVYTPPPFPYTLPLSTGASGASHTTVPVSLPYARGGSRIDLRGGLSIPRTLARAKFYVLRPLLTSFPHTTSYTKKK